ncbi:hypothetical protein SLS62_009186 [Diatrype stigma]|uniref:DUF7137 domain-containing protein n=1 Tax=Diatrype stigma TaxID=117547 RepID=A0AAN9UFW9_9PEZI
MKGPRSLSQILTIAVALAPLTTAWSNWLPDLDALVVRQDDATTTAEPAATPTTNDATTTADDQKTTASPTTDDATTTAGDAKTTDNAKTTNLNTGGQSKTGSASGSATSSSGRKTFSAIDGAGGVAMISPPTTAGSQYYKIEAPTPITWVWNYTSLQGTPTAIDVMVSCSTATASWTLTQNMTFEETASFTWDTRAYQTSHVDNKLVTAEYTLIIWDADTSYSDTAEAGYLAPFNTWRFGLYAAQPYHNLSDWECVTCSAANAGLDRSAFKFAASMSLITVLTFTWYVVGVAGLL